jgi:hypothetical protein
MSAPLTTLLAFLFVPSSSSRLGRRFQRLNRQAGQAGQSTAEYALVMLAAAAIAVLLLTWVTKSGVIGHLFSAVFSALVKKII